MMRASLMSGFLVLLLSAGSAQAQQSLTDGGLATARELYASARYDEALAVLNGLRGGDIFQRRSVEQYRSLCLLALGRGPEAESAIEAAVTADPLYVPTESEAAPRVRAAFSEVRQRLLPDIARSRYSVAKASFDRKDHPAAEQQFSELLTLLDDQAMGGRLADLRELAAGFLALSAAANTPPPAPDPEPLPEPEPDPAPVSLANRIFHGEEPDVVQPRTLRQEVPRVPSTIVNMVRDRGVVELVIDEHGRVMLVTIRAGIHPLYDSLLATAAKDWRYEPATYRGTPVRFRKLIQISVTR